MALITWRAGCATRATTIAGTPAKSRTCAATPRARSAGPLVMVGFGGIYIEVLNDTGGRPRSARRRHLSLRASAIAASGIVELEINPLLARPAGVLALDARGRFRPGRPT